jgi:predicted RNA-binding protein YlqC (UPF0109 family)
MTAPEPPPSRDRRVVAERLLVALRALLVVLVNDEQRLSIEPMWCGASTVTLVVKVADPSDLGRLIGKGGRTAAALRHLMAAAGARAGHVTVALDLSVGNDRGPAGLATSGIR